MPLNRKSKVLCSIAITALFFLNASYAVGGHVSSASSTNASMSPALDWANMTVTSTSISSGAPLHIGNLPLASHLPATFGSYCVNDEANVCSGGALTGLLSTQEALAADIEAEGCGGCASGDYEAGWLSYYLTLSNNTIFWGQDGYLVCDDIAGCPAGPLFFAQVWNQNTGHLVWYDNDVASLTAGDSYDFKMTVYPTQNNEIFFDIGEGAPGNPEVIYTLSGGVTISGPDTGYNNQLANWVAFEEQPSMHSDSTEVIFQSMSSYLCPSGGCSWANWGNGQAQQATPSEYAMEYNHYNSGIPVDTFYVNIGSNFPSAGTCMWGTCG